MLHNQLLPLFFWMIELSHIWHLAALSSWLLCPSDIIPLVTGYDLAFWYKMLQAHLVFP